MLPTLEILLALLLVMAMVAVLAARLKVPPAILLVIAGAALALVPGLPRIELEPEFVLLLVLPPIVYQAAVAMSWHEFRFNLRPIALLAVGCVAFTTTAVATACHYLLGFPWGAGFVLGAIVSPPDAVAPLSIMRRLRLPRRIGVILEGEGLANDATALILYRFAVVAVSTGGFAPGEALGTFGAIVVGEIAWGIGVGWLVLRLRRWIGDPRIEIMLSLAIPFLAYWPPEMVGGSGVLATTTAGLYSSWNGLRLISAATRLQGIFFWDFLIYLIEGMIFLVTGLQAHHLIDSIHSYSAAQLALAAALVCAIVIGTRFIWIYPSTYIPRWLFPPIRRRDPSPPWQWPFILGFTGVRGIVSLAAALAIPFATASGQPFPGRDLILFLTFTVIFVTLVGQGLMLPLVVRWLGLTHAGRSEARADRAQEFGARRRAIEHARAKLDRLEEERSLPDDIVAPFRAEHDERLKRAGHRSDGKATHTEFIELRDEIDQALITTERDLVNDLYRAGELKDEARRRIERDLDLREAHLTNLRAEE